MRYLFFDTETTGTPKDYKAHASNTDNWPRIVQLAWLLQEDNGDILSQGNMIIKPEGFEIPEDAAKVHGITTEIALEKGIPLKDVMRHFFTALQMANVVVGHNINFDAHVVDSEFYRIHGKCYVEHMKQLDTMIPSTNFCKIPKAKGYGYKWPKLQELHMKLFECEFDDAHDAFADITATSRCFWELVKRGIIID